MKTNRIALSAALLATTTLAPFAASAQDAPIDDQITVRYQYIPDDRRVTSEVSAVLSLEDLETTGDSDLAGALVRITGISTTGGRFAVVRGLNERYSNTLLNGSPMPSPEPFRRAAPLDIFPTNILSNVLVQKTFSPEFPGEFGGGVIGIETATLPNEGFFTASIGGSFDTVTTGNRGLTYAGSDTDWLGYDDGLRDVPAELAAIFDTTRVGNNLPADQQQAIGRSLVNSELWVLQAVDTDANGSVDLSAGDRFDFDNFSLGLLGAVSYSNEWETREGQRGKGSIGANGLIYENGPVTADRSGLAPLGEGINNFMSTENQIDVSAMVSVGVDWYNDHEINLLSMVLRSTSKEGRTEEQFNAGSSAVVRGDSTEWFERQVIFNQLRGEHVFANLNDLAVDWRISEATATRDAPYQRFVNYQFDDARGAYRYEGDINDNFTRFSEIEDVTSDYGVDLSFPATVFGLDAEFKAGYSNTSREREAFTRRFSFEQGSVGIPADLLFSRIDYIFAAQNIVDERLRLVETGGLTFPEAYRGELDVEAYYVGTDVALNDFVRAAVGFRFEDGTQSVDTFAYPPGVPNGVDTAPIAEEYALPAVTLTWTFADNIQLRTGYSQSIARPQFRELAFSEFFNTDTDQRFQGNPFLVNTEIESFDARLEYYFGRDQFFTVGAFHKIMENPIEEFIIPIGDGLNTSFINAPEATLTGAEFEFEKTFDLSNRFQNALFADREWFFKTNYTYIQSEVSAEGNVIVAQGAFGQPQALSLNAAGFIEDGRTLQGQSEHLFNAQVGFEANDGRSRAAVLYNYTGERTRAVANLSDNLPEIVEQVPSSLDFVYSRTVNVAEADWDIGFSVRNILGDGYEATQSDDTVELPVDTYDVGTSFSISISRQW
ncbi:TonB-dependent receptor [Maricaulis sp.]|uniref:TonB-dependent receptor domain-containing protein n=1 Tax=Maricaulis sp. TaxID=1486257 RepID=UPI001B10C621|nr:TonB-dependent receptor [Maricaulis sp.]MBO6796154.1 TonB-dependent receptor [Maricaulis sp.]